MASLGPMPLTDEKKFEELLLFGGPEPIEVDGVLPDGREDVQRRRTSLHRPDRKKWKGG